MESHWNLSVYLLLQHSLSYSDWHTTLLKYPPVPSHCIQKKIQHLFLGLWSLTCCAPAYLLACLFCPLLPFSLCSSHTSPWRTKLSPTTGRFHWQFFLPAILSCRNTSSLLTFILAEMTQRNLPPWPELKSLHLSPCLIMFHFHPSIYHYLVFSFAVVCLFVPYLAHLVYHGIPSA